MFLLRSFSEGGNMTKKKTKNKPTDLETLALLDNKPQSIVQIKQPSYEAALAAFVGIKRRLRVNK
jgi:hypothetical protein